MYMQHVILFILSMNVFLSTCRPHSATGKYKFCGAHLIDSLQLICGHEGYRSPLWDVSANEKLPVDHIVNYREINRAGIATECCHKGCSLQTLSSYCADPRRKIRESDLFDLGSLGAELIPVGEDSSGDALPKLMAAAPEVGKAKRGRRLEETGTGTGTGTGAKRHVGNKGNKGGEGRRGRRGRRGREGRAPECTCSEVRARSKRPQRARKMDFESMKRSAPVFGTVSPEYMRLPRTLDEVPEPFRGFQSGI